MKKINLIIFFFSIYVSSGAQINDGTMSVKKTPKPNENCYNFEIFIGEIFFNIKSENTLTHSQLINSYGFLSIHRKDRCKIKYKFELVSYDETINNKNTIHINKSLKTDNKDYLRMLDSAKTITFSNCVIKVTTEDKKDTVIFIPPKTFYILPDK